MNMIKNYQFQSILAPYIRDFIAEKRALGYIFNGKAYQLYRFDKYWLEYGNGSVNLTLEKLDKWLCALPDESKSSHNSRIGAVRSIAIYLNVHGVTSYIPLDSVGADKPLVHILSKTEMHELFKVIDSYVPKTNCPGFKRLADEYPIIFRLYYCCGMRNNEVCSLKTSDVNLEKGIITVYDGKNQKDRLVYLPKDLQQLMVAYYLSLKSTLNCEPYWFFPGLDSTKHIEKTTIDMKFKEFWKHTPSAAHCEKAPTPHALRHGFVVDRINSWAISGVDLNLMLIYLSKYLGHKSPDESFYYYHLVSDAFRIVRQKDNLTKDVLPEVRRR